MACSCQIVALNWQTSDQPMWLNQGDALTGSRCDAMRCDAMLCAIPLPRSSDWPTAFAHPAMPLFDGPRPLRGALMCPRAHLHARTHV